MPLEIRELIIRTKVESQSQEGAGTDSSQTNPKSNDVREIAEMVLKIIKESVER